MCLAPKSSVCSLPLLSFHFLFTLLRHNLHINVFFLFQVLESVVFKIIDWCNHSISQSPHTLTPSTES